jgi:predicted RNA-binding Zn-ribbon protein involved in translation (DUF1610 family)
MPTVQCTNCGRSVRYLDGATGVISCPHCGERLSEGAPTTNSRQDAPYSPPEPRIPYGLILQIAIPMIVFLAVAGLGIWGGIDARGLACILTFAMVFLGGFYTAIRGVFASRAKLLEMSAWIGTTNPTVARILCVITLIVLTAIGCLIAYIAFSATFRRSTGIIQIDQK